MQQAVRFRLRSLLLLPFRLDMPATARGKLGTASSRLSVLNDRFDDQLSMILVLQSAGGLGARDWKRPTPFASPLLTLSIAQPIWGQVNGCFRGACILHVFTGGTPVPLGQPNGCFCGTYILQVFTGGTPVPL